ncbi:MAG: heavy-metal-associated domain-containing protein [Flavobacteriales bacterium]
MRTLSFLISLSFLVVSCGQQEPEVTEMPVQPETVEVVPNAEAEMFVSGMTCVMGCKGAIEKSLNTHEGVASVAIVFEDSVATVSFDSTLVSAEELANVVGSVAGGGLYKATLLTE